MKSQTAWARWRYEKIRKAKAYAAVKLEDPVWLEAQDRRYDALERSSRVSLRKDTPP
jgi:hypothetical protein|tara:strand:- start:871 stop:1041 length:171 start_codon:yes stop_codon:yes gene_type:complete